MALLPKRRKLQTKSGTRIPFYLTAVSLEIDGRKYFTGVGIDITERKRAEEEKEKLQAQLHQAQKMESVGRLGRRRGPRLQQHAGGDSRPCGDWRWPQVDPGAAAP